VHIVGNSMGGGVGINFAIHNPDRVDRLVTIGGIGTNVFSPSPSEGIRLLQEFVEDPTRQRLVDWLKSMLWTSPWSPMNSSRNPGNWPPIR
jgi:pimeloyl-ACP methyl ester carboxylesterase